MAFLLDDLDELLEHEFLAASIVGLRVLGSGDTLEVDLGLRWGWSATGHESGTPAGAVGARCRGVERWSLSGGAVSTLAISDDHPALLEHVAATSRLSYRGAPSDVTALVAALRLAGDRAFDGWLEAGVNEAAFPPGATTGTLAEGPTPLLEIYAGVLRQDGLEALLTQITEPTHPASAPALKVLLIDDGCIVATEFEPYGVLPMTLPWD